jgi:hypothetical protein
MRIDVGIAQMELEEGVFCEGLPFPFEESTRHPGEEICAGGRKEVAGNLL